jgi:hypothetical protein
MVRFLRDAGGAAFRARLIVSFGNSIYVWGSVIRLSCWAWPSAISRAASIRNNPSVRRLCAILAALGLDDASNRHIRNGHPRFHAFEAVRDPRFGSLTTCMGCSRSHDLCRHGVALCHPHHRKEPGILRP